MRTTYPFVSFFLVSILLLESLGVGFGRESTFLLIITLSPIFFIHMIFSKKKIVVPKNASILFVIFIIISIISSVFGVNILGSIKHSLYLIALFLVFLYSYNYQRSLEKPITILIFSISILLTFYSLLLRLPYLNSLIPLTGAQFIFPRSYSHNHLGDLLVLPTIISIYYLYARRKIWPAICCILFTFPFIFFSFSRSAYLSLALTSLAIHFFFLIKTHTSRYKLLSRFLILGLVLASIFYIFTVSHQASSQPLLKKVHSFLVQDNGLNRYKDVLGYRTNYLNQAFFSIQRNLFIGIGPDNFSYASKKYTENRLELSMSAHNIFLEVLVGNGILGILPFAAIILLILINSQKNAIYFVFLGMLINFQTDYTYQIYSFLLLFFVLAGILSTEKGIGISIPFKKLLRFAYK